MCAQLEPADPQISKVWPLLKPAVWTHVWITVFYLIFLVPVIIHAAHRPVEHSNKPLVFFKCNKTLPLFHLDQCLLPKTIQININCGLILMELVNK